MEKERGIASVREHLEKGEELSHFHIAALVEAYVYGTATPMMSLIKTTRMMYQIVLEGQTILYRDRDAEQKRVDSSNFKEFIIEYFDEFVYQETIGEDRGLYV